VDSKKNFVEKLKNLKMGWQPRVSMFIGLTTTLLFIVCKTHSNEITVLNVQSLDKGENQSSNTLKNISNLVLVETSTISDNFTISHDLTKKLLEVENSTHPEPDSNSSVQNRILGSPNKEEEFRPATDLFDIEIFNRLHNQGKTKHPEEIVDRSLPPTKESLDIQYKKIVSRKGRAGLNDPTAKTSEEVLNEIVNYGLDQSRYLFDVQEKQIYNKGLVIQKSDPAHFVGAFNKQTQRAKDLSKYGYATLQASSLLSKQ